MTKIIKLSKKQQKEIEEFISKYRLIKMDQERIITPDQKVPHQFGYSSLGFPNGNRELRYR